MKNPSQLILKSEKDFTNFAKQVAQRLNEEAEKNKKDLEDNYVLEFMD